MATKQELIARLQGIATDSQKVQMQMNTLQNQLVKWQGQAELLQEQIQGLEKEEESSKPKEVPAPKVKAKKK